jgi:SAM-dependent methyltransferase
LKDKSNGYEAIAKSFISARDPHIGSGTVRKWAAALPPGASVLDLGCGAGIPISQALIKAGCRVYGVDASATLIAAFLKSFPGAPAQCVSVEDCYFFRRPFDAVVAWGLMFLLSPDAQATLMARVAQALLPGGRFLFTAPREAATWNDALTGRESVSLGFPAYVALLESAGLMWDGEVDEGDNFYYFARKPGAV